MTDFSDPDFFIKMLGQSELQIIIIFNMHYPDW
jgi:hypothetical protein